MDVPPKANMFSIEIDVGFVPEADFLWGNHQAVSGDNLATGLKGKTFKLQTVGTFELAIFFGHWRGEKSNPIIPGVAPHGSDRVEEAR